MFDSHVINAMLDQVPFGYLKDYFTQRENRMKCVLNGIMGRMIQFRFGGDEWANNEETKWIGPADTYIVPVNKLEVVKAIREHSKVALMDAIAIYRTFLKGVYSGELNCDGYERSMDLHKKTSRVL